MTTAADRFTDAILVSWDSREPWLMTAERGLSDYDAQALRDLCAETGDDYETSAADVLRFVRQKVEC